MTSEEKKAELYKMAKEDSSLVSLMRLFDSDNAPWWAFSQLIDNEAALRNLDLVIPISYADEDRIEEAYRAIVNCCWYLADVVDDSYREVFGRSFGGVRELATTISRRLK